MLQFNQSLLRATKLRNLYEPWAARQGDIEGKQGLPKNISHGLRNSDAGARNSLFLFWINLSIPQNSCHSGLEVPGFSDFPLQHLEDSQRTLKIRAGPHFSNGFLCVFKVYVYMVSWSLTAPKQRACAHLAQVFQWSSPPEVSTLPERG